jgi:hypothetical protein
LALHEKPVALGIVRYIEFWFDQYLLPALHKKPVIAMDTPLSTEKAGFILVYKIPGIRLFFCRHTLHVSTPSNIFGVG